MEDYLRMMFRIYFAVFFIAGAATVGLIFFIASIIW